MDTDAKGQVGGLDSESSVKERLARESTSWKCPTCCKTNAEIMAEKDRDVGALGKMESKAQEEVPEELKLAYREDLARPDKQEGQAPAALAAEPEAHNDTHTARQRTLPNTEATTQPTAAQPTAPPPGALAAPQPGPIQQDQGTTAWLDKAIYAVAIALVLMILRQLG